MKLKPCPFCGGKAKMLTVIEDCHPNDGGKWIECQRCSASSVVIFPIMQSVDIDLAEAWNKRAKKEASDAER